MMLKKIKDIFVEELGCDPEILQPQSRLREDLGVSSLEMLGVVLALEEQFSITMEEAEISALQTFQDLEDYIAQKESSQ